MTSFLQVSTTTPIIISIINITEEREAKKSNREEKEKFEKIFSNFEKRKRKGFYFLEIREENEKFKIQILLKVN